MTGNPYHVHISHGAALGSDSLVAGDVAAVDAIIHALRRHTGVDASEYRRPTIERRIRNRMVAIGARTLPSYALLVAHSPDEAVALVERISIKVSEFYRNAEVFDKLRERILPALASAARDRPLRVWSAGCGRGEEAWTLAMLLKDLEIDGIVEATDIDTSALSFARRAQYDRTALGALPEVLRRRFLTPAADESVFAVHTALQPLVRFSTHNLLSDASPPGNGPFDLICCRNVLIYFQRSAQERTFIRLQHALAPDGLLCVGEAEWPCGPSADALYADLPRIRVFHQRNTERAA